MPQKGVKKKLEKGKGEIDKKCFGNI